MKRDQEEQAYIRNAKGNLHKQIAFFLYELRLQLRYEYVEIIEEIW